MLRDRMIEFTDTKEKEWEELKSKVGDGIELPLPDSERWFLATSDGENIIVQSAVRNVRPLKVHDPIKITFQDFARVAEHYNMLFEPGVSGLDKKLELQKSVVNLRYIFVLIYNLL